MDSILIVGGRPETLLKARRLGLRTLSLQHMDRLLPAHAEAADALFLVEYGDWEQTRPLIESAHRAYGFSRVVSLAEQCMVTVGRINDLLGLPGTSEEVALLFKDKLAMRRRMAERGVPTVAAETVEDATGIRKFGAEHGYPVVLKPIGSTGSRGVEIIESEEAVEAAWTRTWELSQRTDLVFGKFFPVGDRFLVEEYVGGPEYSVESCSFDGRHSVVGIVEKHTRGVVEMGHAVPARISAESDAEITDHVCDFLDAMGLRDGVAHTEIKVGPNGPRVIESHDRISGDRIFDLVLGAYDIDLELYAVGAPFGLLPELPRRPRAVGAAATRFLTAEPGKVVGFHGTDEVLAHPSLIDLDISVKVGDTAPVVRDNLDRSGQVLVRGADTDEAAETCDALAAKIIVETVDA
ncbi:ATP-grasp domain-containing protein [Streptomyces sp. AJS327]|uniref:ATP-grasp domain-containing protein n=1 Tax=Streptomyces sp. AJS327 TaxID=2545265 RepID=UPI0015DEE040|nr:ATP-grasp domain-containing protein [Streptomyces sp. AJS327]MBA0051707.1 ATP-grasp domain-containing protein [Streptomyces sp. AJS327]